jgi:cephalosporin hydroxylase
MTADPIEAFYARELTLSHRKMTAHLPRLRELATGLDLAVEFGVRHGASSSALLLGAKHVVSFDTVQRRRALHLQFLAGDRWEYRIADSATVTIPACDLLFIDSLHTYEHCDAELRAHARSVCRYLVFHDSIGYGSVGEPVKRKTTLGIRPAIDALMIRDRSWRIAAHYLDSSGLLVLERG